MSRLAVVDTNVLVSGLLSFDESSPTARIVDGMLLGSFLFLLSEDLLAEYWEVLRRPAIRKRHGLVDRELESVLTAIVSNGAIRDLERSSTSAPDRTDQHLWDLLAAEPGVVLVTGDELLKRKPLSGTEVLSPREFFETIDS